MDLDRPLSYFKLEEPLLKVVHSQEKSYSTMFVSEGERDVMVMSYVGGKWVHHLLLEVPKIIS